MRALYQKRWLFCRISLEPRFRQLDCTPPNVALLEKRNISYPFTQNPTLPFQPFIGLDVSLDSTIIDRALLISRCSIHTGKWNPSMNRINKMWLAFSPMNLRSHKQSCCSTLWEKVYVYVRESQIPENFHGRFLRADLPARGHLFHTPKNRLDIRYWKVWRRFSSIHFKNSMKCSKFPEV